jgi:hypothetical protein
MRRHQYRSIFVSHSQKQSIDLAIGGTFQAFGRIPCSDTAV